MASLKMVLAMFMVAMLALAAAIPSGYFFLDDQEMEGPLSRVRRDDSYGHQAPSYKKPGQVGQVYTFVKTDPKANFKWGVRHKVGSQYA